MMSAGIRGGKQAEVLHRMVLGYAPEIVVADAALPERLLLFVARR